MKTYSIKTLDGDRIDIDETDLISKSPVDQLIDRFKIIIVGTKHWIRYLVADNIVCIEEREKDEI